MVGHRPFLEALGTSLPVIALPRWESPTPSTVLSCACSLESRLQGFAFGNGHAIQLREKFGKVIMSRSQERLRNVQYKVIFEKWRVNPT
jgi:hypothetical protein